MNKNTKKLIAREILYFFSAIIIIAITWTIGNSLKIMADNSNKHNQILNTKKQTEITKEAKGLSYEHDWKTHRFDNLYSCCTVHFNLNRTKAEVHAYFIELQESNKLESYYDKLTKKRPGFQDCLSNKLKVNSGSDLNNYVIRFKLTPQDSTNYLASKQVLSTIYDISYELSYFTGLQTLKTAQLTALILAILLYAFRPIIFVLKWSIKTLKD